ncbi:helicase [Microbacterium oleivorans]|uniref:helicase n=1 Tax=Microbacterium oleivorans TaxID=273677 RepID=UPI0021168C2B|nr:helicase [Microbacterium oleivorans]
MAATLAAGCAAVGAAAIRSAQVSAAADGAALAAADVAMGAAPGAPCEQAERVTAHAGVDLVACDIDGVVATVEAAAPVGVFRVHARARAGPPP